MKNLTPSKGIYVLPSFYPRGFTVAIYDHNGLATGRRWFPTETQANDHARLLANVRGRNNAVLERIYRG